MNKKRLAAIAGLIVIGGLYGVVLVSAFIDSPFARSCLMAALFGTIVVPAVLWGYLVFMGKRGDKLRGMDGKEDEGGQP